MTTFSMKSESSPVDSISWTLLVRSMYVGCAEMARHLQVMVEVIKKTLPLKQVCAAILVVLPTSSNDDLLQSDALSTTTDYIAVHPQHYVMLNCASQEDPPRQISTQAGFIIIPSECDSRELSEPHTRLLSENYKWWFICEAAHHPCCYVSL